MISELRAGFIQTEMGAIPDDWEVKPIKEFAAVKGGKRLPLGTFVVDRVTPHPYLRVTDMRPGGVDLSDIKYVPEDAFPAIKNYRISAADIFISVAGSLGIVGKIPVELDGANLTENADKITAITCDRDFLLFQLMSTRIQGIIDSEKTVGAQPKLALGRIESFAIALPPTLREQRAIAAALSDVDALLAKLNALIAKKRDLKQAAMQQLLTGQTRLPTFNVKWEIRILGDLGIWLGGATPSMRNNEYWEDGSIPWASSGDVKSTLLAETAKLITDKAVKESSTTLVPKNTILIVTRSGILRRRLPVARTCMAVAINQDIKALIPSSSIDSDFLLQTLENAGPSILASCMKAGTTVESIEYGWLKKFQVAIPALAEQTAIATILSDMDAEIAALEARRDKTRELKQGMMQELLTGRIRLVGGLDCEPTPTQEPPR